MAENWEDALFNNEPLFPKRQDAWNEVAALGMGMTAEQRLQEQRELLKEVEEEQKRGGQESHPRPPAQQAPAHGHAAIQGVQVYGRGHISTSEESDDEAEAVHHVGGDSGWSERQRGRRRSSQLREEKSPRSPKSPKSPKKKSSRRKSRELVGAKARGGDDENADNQDSATQITSLVSDRRDGYQKLTPHGSGVAGGISLLGTTATHARMCLSCAVLALAFYSHTLGMVPALLGQATSLVLLLQGTRCVHFARAHLREMSVSMGYKKPPAFTLSDTCASAWGAWAGVLADTHEFLLLVCLCCATVVLGAEGLLLLLPAMSTLGRSVLAAQVACCFAFYPRLRYVPHPEFWCQVIFSLGILSLLAGQSDDNPEATISPLVNASRPVNATTGPASSGTSSVHLPGFDGAMSWARAPGLLQAVSLYVCVCAAALRGTWAVILPMRDGEGSDGAVGASTGRKALSVSWAWQSAFALIGASFLFFSVTDCPIPVPNSSAAARGVFLLAFSQIANFGTQLTPARALLERNVLGRMFVPRAGGLGFVRGFLRGVFRASLVVLIVLAAATCPRFARWVALAGAVGGVPCAIVLPSALSLSCKSSVSAKLLDLITVGVGCTVSISGLSQVYSDVMKDHDWGFAKLGWA
mmetsp:Transcript_50186/g.122459  ORF Transcript_50186/g.122459 Transcript_50186/m.122459 type:complete len:639 (-) Transcript_50186:1245-3161(-)|eukprot:CAMPEP_0206220672 /NCGR_PEP_ID=MMETSP0047_2-20121206/5004_1 /ASSEMBLY_ACC=CAM_ASM_000192 /TAXON_ID=195065 /ORGANISM="Chroomonas mesostigmatica_cf, Strain CCMP1168" /LENGTH=638 /DNA_ID=CAMNT_0053643351 /DNA_START=61 /DNA_END=1977 /DNA_ORIENTATION=-